MKKKIIPVMVITVIAVCLILAFLQMLVTPKFIEDIPEGSMVKEYYANAGGNDVIFFGDCEAYEAISPVTLWEEYGITSYIRGSAQQLVWMSYYMMEDTLRHEKPEVIVFSVCDLMYADPDSTQNKSEREAYNRMTLDGMKWTKSKWDSIQVSMTSEERERSGVWSYIFPLLRYHDRIFELTEEDWKYLFTDKPVTDNGYLMQVGVRPVTQEYYARPLVNYTFSDQCYDYLDRIVKLCEDNDITLVLMKSPSLYPIWYDEYDEQVSEYAASHGLLYINTLKDLDTIGIDWSTDTYDAGLHVNVAGVEKLTKYIGKILQEAYNLKDHRDDIELSAKWEEKSETYHERKETLLQEEKMKEEVKNEE